MAKRILLGIGLSVCLFLPGAGQAQEPNGLAAAPVLQKDAESGTKVARSLNERLFDAARGGRAEEVSRLLQEGADPNAQSCESSKGLCGTPLLVASVRTSEKKICQTLLDAGADPNIRGCYLFLDEKNSRMCFSPMMALLLNQNEGCLRMLLKAGVDVTDYDSHHTWWDAYTGKMNHHNSGPEDYFMSEQMQERLASYAKDSKSKSSVLSLILCQKSPDRKAVQKLAQKGVIPDLTKNVSTRLSQEIQWTLAKNATEGNYRNALLAALLVQENPNPKALEKLLKEGAVFDKAPRIGSGELSVQTQQMLVQYAKGQETSVLSLILAQPNPDLKSVGTLLRDGANISQLSDFSECSARGQQIVAWYGGNDDASLAFVINQKYPDEKSLQILLERNATLWETNEMALSRLAKNLQNLLASRVPDEQSKTKLMSACLETDGLNEEGIKILLDRGTSVPDSTGAGYLPRELQNEIAEYVQSREQKDKDAWLALVLDLRDPNPQAVKTLLQSGADLTTWRPDSECHDYDRNQKMQKIQDIIGKKAFQKSGLKIQPVSNAKDCENRYLLGNPHEL